VRKEIRLTIKENQKEQLKLLFPQETEIDIVVDLIGEYAEFELLGGFKIKSTDEVTFNLVINHIGKNTKSNTLIKAILEDQAVGHFYGLVNIHKGASGTNTYLKEDAMLLSRQAKAEAIPSLEIDENDVRAGHSSAVSPIDEDQLFYLQSRGLDSKTAKTLLIDAFLSPIY
jgi:Fe-S cluster assembly protein SufD